MYRAHTIRMKPTAKQHELLMKHTGASRFAYNWGLKRWIQLYDEYKDGLREDKPNYVLLSSLWTIERPDWALEIARSPITQSLRNLNRAYVNFFNKRAKRPRKKKRSRGINFQFQENLNNPALDGCTIRVPNVGKIKLTE